MDRYAYTLKPDRADKETKTYSRAELELMTTFQLRDICWRERIINGIQAPLDKDELIRQIMRFRGRKDSLFITEYSKEGIERLEELLGTSGINRKQHSLRGCAKIVVYQGIAVTCLDGLTIGYRPELVDTNAFLVSGNQICAVFNLCTCNGKTDRLYLTKSEKMECRESAVKNYRLYCMDRAQSDWFYYFYEKDQRLRPEHLDFYEIPVMDFQVRELLEMDMPLAIDFGTTNTTAGIYLDSGYLERMEGDPSRELLKENEANYVTYIRGDGQETPLLPSVVGVLDINGNDVQYVFGYEADRLFRSSYIDEGFCAFYDIKRWISDPDKEEELVDRQGRRRFVKRREIIKAFLEYVISCATQKFKCRFKSLHLTAPVKQKQLFIRLFKEVLAEYQIMEEGMLDEGVAVLYNSISELIAQKHFRNNKEFKALIIDCGGGTTDLSSSRFTISDKKVAYRINIATAYENGDTDFGGNNLTYRIMELLKTAAACLLGNTGNGQSAEKTIEHMIEEMGTDIFRRIDREGAERVYGPLDAAYREAEAVIPTRFKDYEQRSNVEYFAVMNNFYYLFSLAEEVKKAFYGRKQALRVAVSSVPVSETGTIHVQAERFKLSVRRDDRLQMVKEFPPVYLNISQVSRLLEGDIYRLVKRFIEPLYEDGRLEDYAIMRLTGQSCKIGLFREALKEFIPGKVIESSKRSTFGEEDYGLKLMCLDGAIKYIRDKRFGYADITITSEQAAFPYIVTAITHTGEERILIHSLDREQTQGYIARTIADLTLQLYLKDMDGQERYKYNCSFNPDEFRPVEADEIVEKYHGRIPQDDVDTIVNKELRSFILADEQRWGFMVVPVLREGEQLMLGPDKFFLFETEGWMTNFFDGTK
ncbi:MAG: molecular chaperone [Lachnospiraceae bacterium]|nr:molecular chaperone [Lachnospiraceae bacterium]